LLSACEGHKCLLSVSNSFKTCIISVDLGKAFKCFFHFNRYIPILNRVAKSIENILRYHKVSFDTQDTLVTKIIGFRKRSFFMSHTSRPHCSPFNIRNHFTISFDFQKHMLRYTDNDNNGMTGKTVIVYKGNLTAYKSFSYGNTNTAICFKNKN